MPINTHPTPTATPVTNDSAKAKPQEPEIEFSLKDPKYSFSDIVLTKNMKDEILDALSVFEFRTLLFETWNLQSVIKKPLSFCINFYGEPGTGKSMVANAVASHLGLKVIQVDYSEIESKYVGETSKNLARLFKEAEEKQAVIIFDEADALLSKRVTDMRSSNDVSVNQTRSVLLTLMDDFKGIIVFTTNFITNFDPAFMRRIPSHIKFDFPSEEVRHSLLQFYLTDTVPHTIDIDKIAKESQGITGSDISNALMNSALKTARAKRDTLTHDDFSYAIKSILASKKANQDQSQSNVTVTTEVVSEEEAMSAINKQNGNTSATSIKEVKTVDGFEETEQ